MSAITYQLSADIFLTAEEEKEIQSYQNGNHRAPKSNIEAFCPKLDIEYLFNSRYHQLKGFVRKRVHTDEDAEDLVQNTFVEALKKAANFKGLSRPDVWLFGIALNLTRNHRKKEANRHRVWEESIANDPCMETEAFNPSDKLENEDLLSRLNRAADKLPEEMQHVLNIVIFDNLSYQQAAKKIGVPTGTVRSRLSRARDKLKMAIA